MTKTVYGGVNLEGQKVLLTANTLAYYTGAIMTKTVYGGVNLEGQKFRLRQTL